MFRAIGQFCLDEPIAAWFAFALLVLVIQLAIDARLGEVAECFNAWGVVAALWTWMRGGDPLAVHFLAGQQRLGAGALPLAMLIMTVQPLLYGGVVVLAIPLSRTAPAGIGGARGADPRQSAPHRP